MGRQGSLHKQTVLKLREQQQQGKAKKLHAADPSSILLASE